MKRRLINGCVVVAKALLIAWALMYLTEYFGWHLASEAGGEHMTLHRDLEQRTLF